MLRFFHRRQRGQVFMFAALLLPVLLGMAGMAIDIGTYAGHKRHLQNAADSIALAAAAQMCVTTCTDTAAATTAGNQWATKNNIDPAKVTLVFSGGTTAPKVRVSINSSHDFAFMRIVGIDSKGIGAAAASVKASFGGSNGIVPWSVTQDTVDAAGSGNLMVMKYDATGANVGNFGAIRIDGPGANTYQNSVMYGSQEYACAVTAANCTAGACPGTYPETCAENSSTCDGPDCDPQTGNVIGPTRDGVDFRMNNTSAACDTFEEAFPLLSAYRHVSDPPALAAALDALPSGGGKLFSPPQGPLEKQPTDTPTNTPVPPTDTPVPTATNTPLPPTATNTPLPTSTNTPGPSPTPSSTNTPGPSPTPTPGAGGTGYRLNPDCNPWTDGPGKCANNNAGTLCSRRVIMIPVVDSFHAGASTPEQIQRFALVYLEGYDSGKCQGNVCEIKGRFVQADVNMSALAGAYDPQALVHFEKLTE
jgi:Flp pilus assembly protein TadG